MSDILTIVLRLVAIVVFAILGYAAVVASKYAKSKLTESEIAQLTAVTGIIKEFIDNIDMSAYTTAEERKQYIEELLINSGYTITKAIEVLIESSLANIETTTADTSSEGTSEETVEIPETVILETAGSLDDVDNSGDVYL